MNVPIADANRWLIRHIALPLMLAVGVGALLTPPLGVDAQRGGTTEVGDSLARLAAGSGEREAWDRVSRAPHLEKLKLATRFLTDFPESRLAPLAHFQIAARAFEKGEYGRFVEHGEAALHGFGPIIEQAPAQRTRRLQLLGRLAFYYAETGAAHAAEERAGAILDDLQSTAPPPGFGAIQWRQFRRLSQAAAHYALGRAALSRALRPAGPDGDSETNWPARAVDELQTSIRLNPADGYAAFRLGDAYKLLGEDFEAVGAYARAAVIPGPAAPPARKKLAESARREGVDGYLRRARAALEDEMQQAPRALLVSEAVGPHPVFWWDGVPDDVRRNSVDAPFSNIRFQDYAGPEACRPCHQDKYEAWRNHSHSRMNAWATEENVKGDFSGEARIRYQGGEAAFLTREGTRLMRLRRGTLERTYRVVRTLGSRFFQYYVGVQVEGPEPRDHPVYQVDHVLPFGYWLEPAEWVPVVHINEELPDDQRTDLFARPSRVAYDRSCSPCHTTRPFGDWLMTTDGRLRAGAFSPREFSFDLWGYLKRAHPELLPPESRPFDFTLNAVRGLLNQQVNALPAKDHAVVLGVSCEACHNGAREHVRRSEERTTEQRPLFFPAGDEILIPAREARRPDRLWGRKPENLKWICSRCHSGGRPRFAADIDTWNSTEFSDAVRGACYTGATEGGFGPLTCTHCHDPHFTIGKAWSRPARLDDAKCLTCHPALRAANARLAHTRHPAESEGDRCMNCHMPRLNEGLQEVVRTHHIFSPTEPSMLEANQPNACNLCHVDRSVQWTLGHLDEWYGRNYDLDRIREATPNPAAPATVGWLASPHEPTRLVAADALGRAKARWALSGLIDMLDDPYLINRQFTQRRLEQMLGVPLQEYGYRFYQSRKERAKPLKALRRALERGTFGEIPARLKDGG